jgi:hypothetical protein
MAQLNYFNGGLSARLATCLIWATVLVSSKTKGK